jgi:hypothetical protein
VTWRRRGLTADWQELAATPKPRPPKAAKIAIADLEASYAMADAPVSPAG